MNKGRNGRIHLYFFDGKEHTSKRSLSLLEITYADEQQTSVYSLYLAISCRVKIISFLFVQSAALKMV